MAPPRIVDTPEWAALAAHQSEIAPLHLRELFASDPDRAERFTVEVGDLVIDYSKHRLTPETVAQGRIATKWAENLIAALAQSRHISFREGRTDRSARPPTTTAG